MFCSENINVRSIFYTIYYKLQSKSFELDIQPKKKKDKDKERKKNEWNEYYNISFLLYWTYIELNGSLVLWIMRQICEEIQLLTCV